MTAPFCLVRSLHAAGRDPMLPRATDRSWCPECGAYFNSSGGFDRHRYGPWKDRRCLTFAQMRTQGWSQTETGHWIRAKWPGKASTNPLGAAIGSGQGR